MLKKSSNDFIGYLASASQAGEEQRLPSLVEMSQEMGVSVSSLREQMEVARALGLIDVRPRTGMRRRPYSFFPAVQQSLFYALAVDPANFQLFAELRNHVEMAYWDEAVQVLQPEDKDALVQLVQQAWEKLKGDPVQIPHAEHRHLHLIIYRRLNNPFVTGLLEAYWNAYEQVGLNLYNDYDYLNQVWHFHEEMVTSICNGDYQTGYQALVEHTGLISTRPANIRKSNT